MKKIKAKNIFPLNIAINMAYGFCPASFAKPTTSTPLEI